MKKPVRKSIKRIRSEGLRALFSALGHEDACRFLDSLGLLKHDWTEDRHLIIGWMSPGEFAAEVAASKKQNAGLLSKMKRAGKVRAPMDDEKVPRRRAKQPPATKAL